MSTRLTHQGVQNKSNRELSSAHRRELFVYLIRRAQDCGWRPLCCAIRQAVLDETEAGPDVADDRLIEKEARCAQRALCWLAQQLCQECQLHLHIFGPAPHPKVACKQLVCRIS